MVLNIIDRFAGDQRSSADRTCSKILTLEAKRADVDRRISSATTEAEQTRQAAADAVDSTGFEATLEAVAKASARVDALEGARAKLEAERAGLMVELAAARARDIEGEIAGLRAQIDERHAKARPLLDKLSKIMGTPAPYSLLALYRDTIIPADVPNLDPFAPCIWAAPNTPETHTMHQHATITHASEVSSLRTNPTVGAREYLEAYRRRMATPEAA